MTSRDELLGLLESIRDRLETPSAPAQKILGHITGYSEQRSFVKVKDHCGEVVELIPLNDTSATLTLSLTHPQSGESLVFDVPVPPEVFDFYASSRAKVARSVPHLAEELDNSLRGVKDDHDRAVDEHERSGDYSAAGQRLKAMTKKKAAKPRKTARKKK